jgi:hypothetical protein
MNPFYNPMTDLQNLRNQVDRQIQAVQQQQQYAPPQVTQNFQITPTSNTDLDVRYAEDIKEVEGNVALRTTLFINKATSKLWIKDVTGKVRTFDINEVIELDEKDKEILELKEEIKKLKGEDIVHESTNTNVDESNTNKKS